MDGGNRTGGPCGHDPFAGYRILMKTKLEILTGILIALFYTLAAVWIIEAAKADGIPLREATYQKPKIPYCDKPLWDRIRTGCE